MDHDFHRRLRFYFIFIHFFVNEMESKEKKYCYYHSTSPQSPFADRRIFMHFFQTPHFCLRHHQIHFAGQFLMARIGILCLIQPSLDCFHSFQLIPGHTYLL